MKLCRVVLAKPMRVAGMRQADVEITDAECEGLRYDEKLGTVVLGDVHVPLSGVISMEKDNEMLVCSECQQECANAQGLGAHRWRAHGIKGEGKGAA